MDKSYDQLNNRLICFFILETREKQSRMAQNKPSVTMAVSKLVFHDVNGESAKILSRQIREIERQMLLIVLRNQDVSYGDQDG